MYAYIWNGDDSKNISNHYTSNGLGTFNINPKGLLSGFYIGGFNFISCVARAIQEMSDDQKLSVKYALGLI